MKEERATMSAQEERLRRLIINYTAAEARKEIKWEVNRGKPVPTDDAVEEILLQEAAQDEVDRRANMEAACTLREVWKASVDRVTVPVEEHPTVQGVDPEPEFYPAPSDRLRLNKRLLDAVVGAGRLILQRNRIEARIKRAVAARTGRQRKIRDAYFEGVDGVVSLQIPVPAVSLVRLRTVPPPAVDSDLVFEDPLTLYQPFHYKMKELPTQPFSEHAFANAEPGKVLPLRKAGPGREEEVPTARTDWDPSVFQPPPAVEAHYKTHKPFLQPLAMQFFPWHHVSEVDEDAPPHRDLLFDTGVKPPTFDASLMNVEVLEAPLPAQLLGPREEDMMSDTEGEDTAPPLWDKPTGLRSIAALPWLPELDSLFEPGENPGHDPADGDGDGDPPDADGRGAAAGVTVCPTTLPIHTHDSVEQNASVVAHLTEFQDSLEGLLALLPDPLRKVV
eukprot:TRINITY_DN18493_c0_g1_i1.p1 TRINITY_DN18493_c0_g1~~TRINITY_DN18493_c0_g1_i1.p1  ORF type:complete len:447 (+),score=176.30 TRINITY_DN18493_c0_g1_i1:135-1475(+)